MDNTAVTALSLLRIFLLVLGGIMVIWGIYDTFGDPQSNNMGIKKIIGGAAFMAISYFLMTWGINQVTAAISQVGG